jgi:hypothetical protein
MVSSGLLFWAQSTQLTRQLSRLKRRSNGSRSKDRSNRRSKKNRRRKASPVSFIFTSSVLVATLVAAIAASIHATINLAAFAIELAIDPVALAIQAIRQAIFSRCIGAIRLAIQATIDAITLLVETMLDAITTIAYAISCTIVGAVSLIGKYGSADDQQNA